MLEREDLTFIMNIMLVKKGMIRTLHSLPMA